MQGSERLAQLDQHFVDIYEATRAQEVERQKSVALIVIQDDQLMLYRKGRAMERFFGLMPPLYEKMKTLGHISLGVYCLLHDQADRPLDESRLVQLTDYRNAIQAARPDLDTTEEARTGVLPAPSPVLGIVIPFLDAVIANGRASGEELADFGKSVGPEIPALLTAAARVQLDACDALIREIRLTRLTDEEWENLRVLVLGPYMARQGQLFLQYFSRLLNTPAQGDRRVVYFDGKDIGEALDRLGTTMLDAQASHAIFGERDRLHRDVLADATTDYLSRLTNA
ncbi:MAG: hypothetical protein AAGF09_07150 [Pseudomonadota bacterium]